MQESLDPNTGPLTSEGRMVKRTMLLVVVVSLSCGLLLAHDMWLESSSFLTQPGEIVTIRNGNGTIYSKSENAVAPERIAALKGMSPSGEALRLGEPGVDGDWLALDFRPREAGTYWIGLATKPRQIRLSGGDFNDYLEHDGIPQALAHRKKQGILDREENEEYSKYVKICLQAGGEKSDNHTRPLGLKIEIVPLTNPYRLKAGDELLVQVLYDDRPLAGLSIHAGYAGQAKEPVHRVTDGEGRAVIPISSPGRWYVRGIHLFQVDEEDHSYESYWATLTFEVAE